MPIQERKIGDCIIEVRIKEVVPMDPRHENLRNSLNIPKKEVTCRAGSQILCFREKIPVNNVQFIFNSFKRHFHEVVEDSRNLQKIEEGEA